MMYIKYNFHLMIRKKTEFYKSVGLIPANEIGALSLMKM